MKEQNPLPEIFGTMPEPLKAMIEGFMGESMESLIAGNLEYFRVSSSATGQFKDIVLRELAGVEYDIESHPDTLAQIMTSTIMPISLYIMQLPSGRGESLTSSALTTVMLRGVVSSSPERQGLRSLEIPEQEREKLSRFLDRIAAEIETLQAQEKSSSQSR